MKFTYAYIVLHTVLKVQFMSQNVDFDETYFKYFAILCNSSQYVAIRCNTLQYFAMLQITLKYFKILHNTSKYFKILCNTLQYFAILCNTSYTSKTPIFSENIIIDLSMKTKKINISKMYVKPVEGS